MPEVEALCSTHLDFGASVQASRQQLPGLDGHRRQLPLVLQNVSDGVDVGNTGLLFIIHGNLPIPADPQMSVKLQFGNFVCGKVPTQYPAPLIPVLKHK